MAVLQVRLGLSRYDAAFAEKTPSGGSNTSQTRPTVTINGPDQRENVTRASIIPKNMNRRTLSAGSTAYTLAEDPTQFKEEKEDLEAGATPVEEESGPSEGAAVAVGNMVLDRPMSIHFERTIVHQVDEP